MSDTALLAARFEVRTGRRSNRARYTRSAANRIASATPGAKIIEHR